MKSALKVRDTVIRRAVESEAAEIVRVIGEGFDRARQEMFIYGCSGAAAYIADHLALPHSMSDSTYTVAVEQGRIVAAAELRRFRDTLFLNYIAVAASTRSRGIAGELLGKAIRDVGTTFSVMMLDVFEDNAVARGWYERLGFEEEARTIWRVLDLHRPMTQPRFYVRGYPQAEAAQLRFGFSQFEVITLRNSYSVGRLGSEWFRITEPGGLQDSDLLGALQSIDPSRRLLALVPKHADTNALGSVAAVAIRMRTSLDDLLERLA